MGCDVLATHRLAIRIPWCLLLLVLILLAGCTVNQPTKPLTRKGTSFWPSAPDEPHIQFLVAYNNSLDVAPPESSFNRLIYGAESRENYAINKPYGVRMWNGCIYVCDIRSKGITVLDLRKHQTRIMGATGVTTISKAVDIAIAPDGTKYVADANQKAILVFSPDEHFAGMFRLNNIYPVGIAIHGDLLYVTNFFDKKDNPLKLADVRVLDRKTGMELRTIGQRGGEDGSFIAPLGITTDTEGNIYVSDTLKARVQKFSPDGKLLLAWGSTGNHPGNFIRPKQLGVGSDGRIHVVDAAFNNVQVFDPEGRFEGYYGSPGKHPGAMDLPAGLDIHEGDLDLFAQYIHPAFEAERLILVANQFGDQMIAVYAMGHLKPGKTLADITAGRALVESGLLPTTQPATQPAAKDVKKPMR